VTESQRYAATMPDAMTPALGAQPKIAY
jgi:hypothetical protein